MRSLAIVAVLACVAGGCGAGSHSSKRTVTVTALDRMKAADAAMQSCFEARGYRVTPITPAALATAPARFRFIDVWDLVNPDRVALAIAISRSTDGAARATAWTRRLNARIGKGVVKAPVVRIGRIAVLWTAEPNRGDKARIYGCVRKTL